MCWVSQQKRLDQLELSAHRAAGEPFLVSSTQQLRYVSHRVQNRSTQARHALELKETWP